MFLTQEEVERIRAAIARDSESWLKLTARVNEVCEKLAAAWQEIADKYQAAYDKAVAEQAEFERVLAEQEAKAKEVEPEKEG